MSTEALLLSCLIDSNEDRDVATVDIPGAFMQSDMEGPDVHMKLEGKMVHILAKIDPNLYDKYINNEKNKPVMYVKLKKALYGTIHAALLFWKNLSKTLTSPEWGFKINPYDWCVANKTVNGKQLTVVWHVDDMKISHVEEEVVTALINKLNDRYGKTPSGKEKPLTVKRGKIHDYLGMKLDYSTKFKVRIDMREYLEKILTDLDDIGNEWSGTAVTPAAEHLFKINDNAMKLSTSSSVQFHHVVAQLLFLCKRGRPDIQTGVAFLTNRIKEPDTDDLQKLKRVIKYLRGSKNLVLTLECDDSSTISWWVDAAFGVHQDMRSHTGGMLSLGKGSVYATSTKQKLNTKSSTEAELVAVDDLMPQILWTKMFLEAQGLKVQDNIIYQDNQSTMKLANNGRGSSGKRTRHINIRYFFITDRVKRGDVRIIHCPTDMLIADFYTKPLQGKQFRIFRKLILNLDDDVSHNHMLAEQETNKLPIHTIPSIKKNVGLSANRRSVLVLKFYVRTKTY